MSRFVHVIAATTLLANSALAEERVLFLKCRSPNVPSNTVYTTIDFNSGTAKTSTEPADERTWNRAEITNIVIKWDEHYPTSEATAVFNRYSGNLEYSLKRSGGGLEVAHLECRRTEPPQRLY
jgi:hypothetical protein